MEEYKEEKIDSKKEQNNRNAVIGIIIFTVVLMIYIVASALIPKDNNENKGGGLGDVDSGGNVNPPQTQVEIIEHGLNETFVFDELEYTFTKYKISAGYGSYGPSNSNNTYIVVYVTVHNPTNKTKSLVIDSWFSSNSKYSYSLFCDSVKYNQVWGYGSEYLMNYESLIAEETIDCVMCFELPEQKAYNANNIILQLTYNKIADQTIFHNIILKKI